MKKVITAFKEHKEFKPERHWDANVLRISKDTITPPHYADTIEIVVNHNVKGTIHVGGRMIAAENSCFYFIPPGAVHAMEYKQSDGYVTVLKINHLPLKKYLDIEAILAAEGCSLDVLPYFVADSRVLEDLEDVFWRTDSLWEVLTAILGFFRRMAAIAVEKQGNADMQENDDLRRLVEWTENNFMHAPTLEEAASILGYSRNYFCKKFKAATGVTYIGYLNCLRINYACAELKKGRSVAEVCYACGFVNPSYFSKLFRTIVGVTPMKYAISQK